MNCDKKVFCEGQKDKKMSWVHRRERFWTAMTCAKVQKCINVDGEKVDVVDRDRRTPLHWAAGWSNDPEAITALLDHGADLFAFDRDGSLPLHLGAGNNINPEAVLTLLEHCEASKRQAFVNVPNGKKWTPLHFAAHYNKNPNMIIFLLNNNADANTKNSAKKRPLYYAKKNKALKGTDALKALEDATQK